MAAEDRTVLDYPASLLIGTWWQQRDGNRLQIVGEPYRVRTAGKNRTKLPVRCGSCGSEFNRPAVSVIRLKASCPGRSHGGELEGDAA